jgi:periplasmic protein TonB
MIDAVDRVLEERAALDRGFGATLALSTFGHAAFVGLMLLATWLGARAPRIREVSGFAVVLPRGGGGPSVVAPRPVPVVAPPPAPVPAPPAAKPEPPPRVLKPPKEEPRAGLPALDSKKARPIERAPAPAAASASRSGTSAAAVPGLDIQGPAGLGAPGGNDASGDWYLAGVQRKIWMIWTRQATPAFTAPIVVSLTITETGAVEDVRVVESAGLQMLDGAAQRAVFTAAPFSPLPRSYGTNRLTIRAVFRPGT